MRLRDSKAGFTIIELMIASAVLSTILLLVTALMISIGSLYYKGVNESSVQDDVRSIATDVSQQLQISDGFTTASSNLSYPNVQAYCVGSMRYTFITGVEIGQTVGVGGSGTTYYHILWRDTNPTPGNCTIDNTNGGALTTENPSDSGGTELIAPNSRLTAFSITGSSPYAISVGVAYGAADLLNLNGINTTCKGGTGDQFCGTASLTTTVVQRITGS